MPAYVTIEFMVKMIPHRINRLTPSYINNIITGREDNPNMKDNFGNTALHNSTYLLDEEKIELLLKNTKTNSLLKNNENLFAFQLIPHTANNPLSNWRRLLFVKHSLDLWIEKEIQYFLLFNPIVNEPDLKINSKRLQDAIVDIKTRARDVKDSQEDDRILPEETSWPSYATNEFLQQAFVARLKDIKPNNEISTIRSLSGSRSGSDSSPAIRIDNKK